MRTVSSSHDQLIITNLCIGPEYSQLPLKPEYPFRAAWDVWGSQDEVGALNHITNDTILAAAQEEIQIGRAINMNLLLGEPYPPFNADRRALVCALHAVMMR